MLFDMGIDMWLFLAPQWEPAEPAVDSDTDLQGCASEQTDAAAPEADAAAVFKGYLIVPSYFWHCEDNAFSIAWHQVLPADIDQDRRDEVARRESDARLRHAAPATPAEPGGDQGSPGCEA